MSVDREHDGKFKKGVSGNLNGRPKKSFSTINAQMRENGVEPLKKRELIEAYLLLFNLNEADLQLLASQDDTPYAMKIIILELNNKFFRMKALQDMRDYCFGGKVYNTELTVLTDGASIKKINYRPETIAMMLRDAGDENIEDSFLEIEGS